MNDDKFQIYSKLNELTQKIEELEKEIRKIWEVIAKHQEHHIQHYRDFYCLKS